MDLFRSQLPSSTGSAGKMFWRRRTVGDLPQQEEIPIPTGYNLTDTQSTWVQLQNRLYGANVGTDNAMIDEYFRFNRVGLQAPHQIPVVTAAAGPGTSGSAVVAYAFYDEKTEELSPLSGASDAVSLSNQGRTISNIQATSNDARATHVVEFVSMDGGAFRRGTMRQLGVTTFTESIATLALGAAFPTTFERMPKVTSVAVLDYRLIGAGNALAPDTVYVSAVGRGERYEGLSFKTLNGETVTALIPAREVCLVMTGVNCYVLRSFKGNDMSMKLLDPGIGCLNNQCWKLLPNGNPVLTNETGIHVWNGAFHNIVRDRQEQWSLFFAANRLQVESSHASVNREDFTWSLFVNSATGSLTVPAEIPNPADVTIGTIAWTMDYSTISPEIEGGLSQPYWYVDVMTRKITTTGLLNIPGSTRFATYYGCDDGLVRGLDATDNDDDGDTFGKRMFLRTGAYNFGDPGGDKQSGKTFTKGITYMEAEFSSWTLYWKGGNEDAWRMLTPDNSTTFWKDAVAASLLVTDPPFSRTYTAESVHNHRPEQVTGRCLTIEIDAPTPLGIRFRGVAGLYGPGVATRPMISVESK